jgi:CheY-like chemotaxis protein
MVLRLLGYIVEIVGDGPAALEEARRGAPDVVLLDIALPKMNGHEVAHRLTADEGFRPFLIAVTDYTGSDAERQCGDNGIDLYLPKPVNLELLQCILEGRKRVLNLADG